MFVLQFVVHDECMSKRHEWVVHTAHRPARGSSIYGGMAACGEPGGPVEGRYGCLEGPRLGPVSVGTGLYSRAPPQPPYLHSFLLHPILIYIISSDKTIMHQFEVLILSTDSNELILCLFCFQRIWVIDMRPTLISIFRNLFCLIHITFHTIKSKPTLFCLIMMMIMPMMMTVVTLRERQVWLPQRQIAVFAVCGGGN